jgi:hypothetical protein
LSLFSSFSFSASAFEEVATKVADGNVVAVGELGGVPGGVVD